MKKLILIIAVFFIFGIVGCATTSKVPPTEEKTSTTWKSHGHRYNKSDRSRLHTNKKHKSSEKSKRRGHRSSNRGRGGLGG